MRILEPQRTGSHGCNLCFLKSGMHPESSAFQETPDDADVSGSGTSLSDNMDQNSSAVIASSDRSYRPSRYSLITYYFKVNSMANLIFSGHIILLRKHIFKDKFLKNQELESHGTCSHCCK